MALTPVQLRVLGSLIEKEITTPEYYPLSLNALLNACNQRSSRDPIMELDEEQVREALDTLEAWGFVTVIRDGRVAKFEHRARTLLNLRRDETAVMCLLLLRGPQTPGELRSRADRLYTFDDLSSVQSTLERLANREPSGDGNAETAGPLVVLLPRQPGARESRYQHLLGNTTALSVETMSASNQRPQQENSLAADRLSALEAEVAMLRSTIVSLEERLAQLETSS